MERPPADRKTTVTPPRRKDHTLSLRNRERLSLDGVLHVDSFDQREIALQTEGGALVIKGEALHIKELNVETSTLTVEGRIRSLEYGDESAADKGKGLLARLLR